MTVGKQNRRPAPGAGRQAGPGMPGPNAQSIRRIEARGGVTVVTKDQNASGDLGIFDLKANTITLTGNVVVSQGQNVMHGERVVVDMTTGRARVESGKAAQNPRPRASSSPARAKMPGGPPKHDAAGGPNKVN